MKKILTLPNLYVLLWALYYTQGTFIAQGSTLSRVVLLLFLAISLYFTVITYTKYKTNAYLRALGWLLIMFTVYGVLGVISGVSYDYLKLIYLSLLPTFPLFVWTKSGKITTKWIKHMFFVLVGVVVVQYIATLRFIEATYKESENSVVNIAYEVLALLPLLFFWKRKPLIQFAMLAIILAVVLSTLKRGAIIIGAVCLVYFFISTGREATKQTKWYVWLLVAVFIVVGFKYVADFYMNSTYAQMRMASTMEGDSSGRDRIFSNAWKIFIESNIFNLLFGHGAWATIRLMRIPAHNDWLEILVNQGFFGAVLYLNYWMAFYKSFKKSNNAVKPVLGMLIIILFLSTLFSMSYSAMTLPENLALGFALAANENKQITD